MDVRTRWRRLDAEHWVHVLGMVLTTVLTLWTAAAVLAGLAVGLVVAAVVPAAIASLVGGLTSAWRRERPWAWWGWTVLATVVLLGALPAVLDMRAVGLPALVVSGVLLLLLVHPDSRARIAARSPFPQLRP
jgi:hypothetical protein